MNEAPRMSLSSISSIRCSTRPDGNIEASTSDRKLIVIDAQTGSVIETTEPLGSDLFRKLVRAARSHMVA